MKIEIHGGQFANKGARKMLITVVDWLRSEFSDCEIYADRCVGSVEELESLGIIPLSIKRGWMGSNRFDRGFRMQRLFALVDSIFPTHLLGIKNITDIDVLIDISGYAFTAKWGVKPSRDFSNLAHWYKSKNKTVVMLPQAFGPFNCEISPHIARIINSSDLIFARDKVSKNNLTDIAKKNLENIFLAPDITIASGRTDKKLVNSSTDKKIAIVPNKRMLDRSSDFWKQNYIDYLSEIISTSGDNQVTVELVVHDSSGDDLEVARELSSKFGLSIIELDDPFKLKTVLSDYLFVVGSRYHALVAALSNSTPVVALGWSHKYDELLADFEVSKFIINEELPKVQMNNLVSSLFNLNTNNLIRETLEKTAKEKEIENRAMFQKVSLHLAKKMKISL